MSDRDEIERLKRENETLRVEAARAGKLARALRKALKHVPESKVSIRKDILDTLTVSDSDATENH